MDWDLTPNRDDWTCRYCGFKNFGSRHRGNPSQRACDKKRGCGRLDPNAPQDNAPQDVAPQHGRRWSPAGWRVGALTLSAQAWPGAGSRVPTESQVFTKFDHLWSPLDWDLSLTTYMYLLIVGFLVGGILWVSVQRWIIEVRREEERRGAQRPGEASGDHGTLKRVREPSEDEASVVSDGPAGPRLRRQRLETSDGTRSGWESWSLCEESGFGLLFEEIDILVGGSAHDLLDREPQNSYIDDLESGCYDMQILSPPCGS